MAIGEWFVLAVACAVAVVGLMVAASGTGGSTYCIGMSLFVVAVAYAFILVKRYFDRIDAARH